MSGVLGAQPGFVGSPGVHGQGRLLSFCGFARQTVIAREIGGMPEKGKTPGDRGLLKKGSGDRSTAFVGSLSVEPRALSLLVGPSEDSVDAKVHWQSNHLRKNPQKDSNPRPPPTKAAL